MIDNLKDYPRPYMGPMICFDPGSTGTGIAFFKSGQTIPSQYESVLSDNRGLESTKWLDNCDNILQKVKLYLHTSITIPQGSPVFIEQPQFFSTHTGYKSAATNSLAKLIFFYGRLWEMCRNFQFQPVAIPILTWKGQMQKIQVQYRVKRAIGIEIDSHACDAVGIGLYMRDKL